jgi:hypothetical protein
MPAALACEVVKWRGAGIVQRQRAKRVGLHGTRLKGATRPAATPADEQAGTAGGFIERRAMPWASMSAHGSEGMGISGPGSEGTGISARGNECIGISGPGSEARDYQLMEVSALQSIYAEVLSCLSLSTARKILRRVAWDSRGQGFVEAIHGQVRIKTT